MTDSILTHQKKAMVEAGFDALIAASPDNVTYSAGFEVPSLQ